MKSIRTLLPILLVAALVVAACTDSRPRFERVLQRAHEQNQAYDSITNIDSLRLAAEYFDRHGSANERMRAHYLLGCAYRDMGDAPRAIEAYHDAADRADTTSNDCDYGLLCRVHSQTASVFSKQFLPELELIEFKEAINCAFHAKDTLLALHVMNKLPKVYYSLGKDDSVLIESSRVEKIFRDMGDDKSANTMLGPALSVLLNRHEYKQARKMLELMDYSSNFHEGKTDYVSREAFLCSHWGDLYIGEGKIDSARDAYEEGLSQCHDMNGEIMNLRGLARLYEHIHQYDSAAKYYKLCDIVSDSIFSSLSTLSMQRLQAVYDYSKYEKSALHSKEIAQRMKFRVVLLSALLLILLLTAYVFWSAYKKRKQQEFIELNYRYNKSLLAYNNAIAEVEEMKGQSSIQKGELEKKEMEIQHLKQELADFQSDQICPEQWEREARQFKNAIVLHLHALAVSCLLPGDTEWRSLRIFMNSSFPSFLPTLESLNRNINLRETNICILVKLRFLPSEMANLLGISPQMVTNIRVRLYKKLTGEKGSTNDFDAFIRNL